MKTRRDFPSGLMFVAGMLIAFGCGRSQAQLTDAASHLKARLKPHIDRAMEEGKIPSVAIALVAEGKIVWSGAYGYSNLWARTPARPKTVYLIGSTFKAMSTYALLQQMEQGKFKLDDPVSDYLDKIKIQGEDAAHPVTFRHLLTHTSGIPADFGGHPVWGSTVPPPLDKYLAKELKVTAPPMTELVYSNMAYSLVGHLVGRMSGTDYKQYIRKEIWLKLGMKDTAFEPRPDMEERLAIPYVVGEASGKQRATVRLKARAWPAGIVYGTVLDQARWLICNLNGGKIGDERLLAEETVDLMMTRQHEKFTGPISDGWLNDTTGYGLTWWISERNGETLFAHSGSVPGYTAFLVGNRDRGTGFAVLTNGNRAHGHLFKLAIKALDLLAEDQE